MECPAWNVKGHFVILSLSKDAIHISAGLSMPGPLSVKKN